MYPKPHYFGTNKIIHFLLDNVYWVHYNELKPITNGEDMNIITVERAKRGLSQGQAAELAQVSQGYWSMVEHGQRPVTGTVLELLEKWGVPQKEILPLSAPTVFETFMAGYKAGRGKGKDAKKSFLNYMNKQTG